MSTFDSVVLKYQLGRQLCRLRELSGKSQLDVTNELGWSKAKLNRIERGLAGIDERDLLRLADCYRVEDTAEVRALVELGSGTRRHSSWSEYRQLVSSEFYAYLAHEEAALSIRIFQDKVVPGVLQTAEYSAVVTGWKGRRSAQEVHQLLELRKRRKAILARLDDALDPPCSFLLGEAALKYHVGGPSVMRDQLEHLISMAQRPNVILRIVPFAYGVHPRWTQSFIVLEVGSLGLKGDLRDVILFLERTSEEASDILVSELDRSAELDMAESSSRMRRASLPSAWLKEFTTVEAEASSLETTLMMLEAALRDFASGSDRQ